MIGKNSVKYHYLKKKILSGHLNMEDITDADYTPAKGVFKDFEIKSLEEYLDLYVQSDTLLLADVFENFRICLKIYELYPETFISTPRLAWKQL